MASNHIPKETADEIVSLLYNKAENEDYFINHNPALLSAVIDNNCDNLLLFNDNPSFLDIMPPKQEWKVSDKYFNIMRTAVDAYALGSKELGNAVLRTYGKYQAEPPINVALIYEIRSALIQWAYRHLINQHNIAQKYKNFTLVKVEELRSL